MHNWTIFAIASKTIPCFLTGYQKWLFNILHSLNNWLIVSWHALISLFIWAYRAFGPPGCTNMSLWPGYPLSMIIFYQVVDCQVDHILQWSGSHCINRLEMDHWSKQSSHFVILDTSSIFLKGPPSSIEWTLFKDQEVCSINHNLCAASIVIFKTIFPLNLIML